MRKINVNVDLYQFNNTMREYLKSITYDDAYWYKSTDSDGKVCYMTTVYLLPLKIFTIANKEDKDYYYNLLIDSCRKEIDNLIDLFSAVHCSINISDGRLVFKSYNLPYKGKIPYHTDCPIPEFLKIIERYITSQTDKVCLYNGEIYYYDASCSFENGLRRTLCDRSTILNKETYIREKCNDSLLQIAKKYGFERYIINLQVGVIRLISSKLPQGWKFVNDSNYILQKENINDNEGIDYPSQHSAVAQQVANQYLNK